MAMGQFAKMLNYPFNTEFQTQQLKESIRNNIIALHDQNIQSKLN